MSAPTAIMDAAPPCSISPDLWFDGDDGDVAAENQAKAICRQCPGMQRCLSEHYNEEFGIYGAMTSRERRGIYPKRNEAAVNTQLRDLYARGLSDSAIADAVGAPKKRISSWRRRNNLPAHVSLTLVDLEAEKRAMHQNGSTDAEIADAFGISKQAVARWRVRRQLPSNYQPGPVVPVVRAPAPTVAERLFAKLADRAADWVIATQSAKVSELAVALNISSAKAQELLKELESRGVVGPKLSGSRARAVLAPTAVAA